MNLRRTIKRTIKNLFLLITLPLYWLMLILTTIGDTDSTFQSFKQAISLIPGKIGIYICAAFYRLVCPGTSDEISIGFLTVFSHHNTTIEEDFYIGPQCNIGKCTIGKNTLLGSGVHILSGKRQHEFGDINSPIQEQGRHYEKVRISEDYWMGNTALVMASLDSHCIVGTGSIITSTAESGGILAGNPARLIRNRLDANANSSILHAREGKAL